MSFLLDTNVVSELRKRRTDRKVRTWFAGVTGRDLFLSVLVLGEIRQGIERLRQRDPVAADVLDEWLSELQRDYSDRVLPVTAAIADRWGELNVPDPLPTVGALLAATALVHGMVLVTRNVSDVRSTGVAVLNPFD